MNTDGHYERGDISRKETFQGVAPEAGSQKRVKADCWGYNDLIMKCCSVRPPMGGGEFMKPLNIPLGHRDSLGLLLQLKIHHQITHPLITYDLAFIVKKLPSELTIGAA